MLEHVKLMMAVLMYDVKIRLGRKGSIRRGNVLTFKGSIVIGEKANSKQLEKGILGMGTGVLRAKRTLLVHSDLVDSRMPC